MSIRGDNMRKNLLLILFHFLAFVQAVIRDIKKSLRRYIEKNM